MTKSELIAKLAARFVVGVVQLVVLFAFGRLAFGISLGPEPWALLLPIVGIVFAIVETMAMLGTTIGLGLLLDTLIVRSLMTPSIAALLGKWFWWPQRVRQRPVPSPWPTSTRTPEPVTVA